MKLFKKVVPVVIFLVFSCGGDDDGPGMTTSDGKGNGEETGGQPDVRAPDDVEETVVANLVAGWIPSGQRSIYTEYYMPGDCSKESPCPALVLVPDGLGPGVEQFECCMKGLSEKLHTVVISYNPPGRGTAGEVSGGEEDFGGPVGQDTLKDIANTFRKKSSIDEGNFGVVSLGFGLATAAGAVARFQATSLDFIGYLIDIEGPTNRCFISQSPYMVNEAEGYYINEDGKGVTTTRCDFDLNFRKVKFPAGTSTDGKGTDGTPHSYICNPNAFVLRESGKTCDDDKWWQEREARTFMPKLVVHYLRIQFLHDHKQPTRYNAREAMHWITQAEAASYQINSVSKNQNLKGYSEDDIVGMGVYLDPKAGNGFGTDVFDVAGDFKPLSMKDLFLSILPPYISRMQKRAAGE